METFEEYVRYLSGLQPVGLSTRDVSICRTMNNCFNENDPE
jgi:hypothetical protein